VQRLSPLSALIQLQFCQKRKKNFKKKKTLDVLNVKYYRKQIGRGPDGLRTRLSTCVRVFLKTHEMTRMVTNTERFKTHGSRHLYAAGSQVLECV
jgi:hypothetical protein